MRITNTLAKPGEIKNIRLEVERVIVVTDKETIVYKRVRGN